MEHMEKKPPQNIMAERAVLGACLLNKEAIYNAMEFVRPNDFYLMAHGAIFEIMLDLNKKSIPCDLVSVSDGLEKAGKLEMVGGYAALARLTSEVPGTAQAEYYARQVADKALQRSMIDSMQKIVADGYGGQKDGIEILGDAESAISKLSQNSLGSSMQYAPRIMSDEFAKIETIKKLDGVTGVPTLRDLDKYLSGLQRSDMIILAARPGCGKTSLAVNIAAKASLQHQKSCVIFSLEMPSGQLAQRILCSFAQIDQRKWRGGELNKEEIKQLDNVVKNFSDKKLFFDDSSGVTIPEMKAKCRRIKAEHGLDLVVVDYLQLMRSPAHSENRQNEIAEISRSLKGMAKELDVPVLALSQLSRMAEQGKESGPMLSHLRESGAIEQDADVVIFINNKRPVNDGADDDDNQYRGDIVEIIVAKNRNGPTGSDEFVFFKQYTKFSDLTEEFENDMPFGADKAAMARDFAPEKEVFGSNFDDPHKGEVAVNDSAANAAAWASSGSGKVEEKVAPKVDDMAGFPSPTFAADDSYGSSYGGTSDVSYNDFSMPDDEYLSSFSDDDYGGIYNPDDDEYEYNDDDAPF